VHHCRVSDKLKILARKLLCQQNTGSNHNNSLRSIRLELLHCIKNTHVGFTASCWKNAYTFRMLQESIQGIMLVGTELNHVSHLLIELLYSKKEVCATPLCQFLKCLSISSSTTTNLV
jgi:hypothetical protein